MKAVFFNKVLLLTLGVFISACSTGPTTNAYTASKYVGKSEGERVAQSSACQAQAAEIMADKHYSQPEPKDLHDVDDYSPRQSDLDQLSTQDMEMTMDRLDQERIVDDCLKDNGWKSL